MLSFHQSRGRILFEAFCATALSASFVGAWMDLGTPAFLPAAAVFGLYGMVRLFDMRGRKPAEAPAGVAEATADLEAQGDLLDYVPPAPPVIAPAVERAAPEPDAAAPVAKKPARARRKKQVGAEPAVAQPLTAAAPESVTVTNLVDRDETQPLPSAEPAERAAEEPDHLPVTPLFEPEPFVRQQRTVFGRKAG